MDRDSFPEGNTTIPELRKTAMRSMKILAGALVVVCTVLVVRFFVKIQEPQEQLTVRDHPFFGHLDKLDEPMLSMFRTDSPSGITRATMATTPAAARGTNADVFERKVLFPSVPIDLEKSVFQTNVNSEHLLPDAGP